MIRILLLIIAATSVLLLGCEKRVPEPQPVTADDVTQQMSEAKNTTAEYAAQRKQEYVAAVQQEIDQLKLKLDHAKARATKAGATAKTKLNRHTEVLDEKWKTAERKLSELRSAGNDRWQHFKEGMDEAIGDLKRSFARSQSDG